MRKSLQGYGYTKLRVPANLLGSYGRIRYLWIMRQNLELKGCKIQRGTTGELDFCHLAPLYLLYFHINFIYFLHTCQRKYRLNQVIRVPQMLHYNQKHSDKCCRCLNRLCSEKYFIFRWEQLNQKIVNKNVSLFCQLVAHAKFIDFYN